MIKFLEQKRRSGQKVEILVAGRHTEAQSRYSGIEIHRRSVFRYETTGISEIAE